MKIKKMLLSGCSAVLVLLSGCTLFSPALNKTAYYDLNYNGKSKLEVPYEINLRRFSNISPAKINMLYANGNSVLLDQYNLWVQSPEVMLNRYMLNAMDCKGKRSGERFDLSVSIFEFELDIAEKKAVLGVFCELRSSDAEKIFSRSYMVEVPAQSDSIGDFVKAMNDAAGKFVIQLVNDIKEIKPQRR